jgi:hypothetical protein
MSRFSQYIRILGLVLLSAGLALLVLGQVTVYRAHGLAELQQMMSPRNLQYYSAVLLVLMPGATLVPLGAWLDAKRRRRRRRSYYLSDFMLRC